MKSIEDFNVGQTAEFKHRISTDDVKRFVELTGDDNPLHTDETFAQQTEFKGIVVHGMLPACYISTLIGKHLPGDGALWISQKFDFLLPVRLNDELRFLAKVAQIHPRQNLLDLEISAQNQHGQTTLKGSSQVKLLSKSSKTAEVPTPKPPPTAKAAKGLFGLVTGASSGIGAAIVRRFAQDGITPIINYRSNESGARGLVEEIESLGRKAFMIQADVSNREEVEAMFERIGRDIGNISILVNNACSKIIESDPVSTPWEHVLEQMETQIKGSLLCTQQAVRMFEILGQGTIINIGSQVIEGNPPPRWSAYTMGKAALHQLTKNLAEALGPKKIRVNTLSPGLTDTEFVSHMPEKSKLLIAAQTPLRANATTDQVAAVAAFLASPDSGHITGQNIRVNGGRFM